MHISGLSTILFALVLGATAATTSTTTALPRQPDPQPCQQIVGPQPVPAPKPTTVDTLGQEYFCVLDHYVDSAHLDNRALLIAAFAGLTQELQRRGLDQPSAMPPAFTGDREHDWISFRDVARRIMTALPDPAVRQAVTAAAMNGMIASLHNDHAWWQRPSGPFYSLGMTTSTRGGSWAQPDAHPPLFITTVGPGSPAAAAGLKAGDILTDVNGIAPFADGQLDQGVLDWIDDLAKLMHNLPSTTDPVRLTVNRPVTGRTWTVIVKPGVFAGPPLVSATVVDTDIAKVTIADFTTGLTDRVLAAINNLHIARPRGVILDLRGNTGGDTREIGRLLGAFVHDKIWGYSVDPHGNRIPGRTDDTVPLLHLSLVVLTDRNCASACDVFSDAVRDLHAGTLVGTRTSGLVAGDAAGYLLDDNTALALPAFDYLGANGESVDGIGVAPNYDIPLTPQTLSAGDDPDLDKAVTLLTREGR